MTAVESNLGTIVPGDDRAELVRRPTRVPLSQRRPLRRRADRAAANDLGLIIGEGANVLRLCPPLIVTETDVDAAIRFWTSRSRR